jgi:hypothetical protein
MRSLFALTAFVSSAFAYQILTPGTSNDWTTAGPNQVTWQQVSTDALNFTMLLVNQVRSRLIRPLPPTPSHSRASHRTRQSYRMAQRPSRPSSTVLHSNSPLPRPAGVSWPELATKSTLSRTQKTQIPFTLSRVNLLSPNPPRRFPPRVLLRPREYSFFSRPLAPIIPFPIPICVYALCTARRQILPHRPRARTAPAISTRPLQPQAPRLLVRTAQIVLPPLVVPPSYLLRWLLLSFNCPPLSRTP